MPREHFGRSAEEDNLSIAGEADLVHIQPTSRRDTRAPVPTLGQRIARQASLHNHASTAQNISALYQPKVTRREFRRICSAEKTSGLTDGSFLGTQLPISITARTPPLHQHTIRPMLRSATARASASETPCEIDARLSYESDGTVQILSVC